MMRESTPAREQVVDRGDLWLSSPYPVLVTDIDRAVIALNVAAASLLPDLVPGAPLPGWVADAERRGAGTRPVEVRRTELGGGEVAWWLVEHPPRCGAEVALAEERERTAFLSDASNVLLSSLNAERCMRATVRLARHLADAVALVAPSVGGRFPTVRCGPDGTVSTDLVSADPSTVPGMSEALQGFPPVPSRWIDPASVPEWLVPTGWSGPIGSVAITPLPGHGIPAGVLVLLRRSDHQAFTDGEETTARLFAARAGAALSAARLYAEQSAITATLMRELLPPQLRHVDGVEFAGAYRTAEDDGLIGGDFYDIHPAADAGRETLVVLGDVCGKGLAAAVLTGKIRTTLRALALTGEDHQRMLTLLNDTLLTARETRFATLVLASVARAGKQVSLRVTSAGHPAPLVVRGDGQVREIATAGTLIGVLPTVTSTTAEVHLAPGETCLLYTDGVTEARGGPLGDGFFGEERLRSALAECAGMPAEAVVERIQMLVTQWVGRRGHDDIAVIAITVPRGSHLSAVDGHSKGRYTP